MAFHAIDRAGKLPSLCVEIDFANDPTNLSRSWTDVTTDVRHLQCTRSGRSDALQQTSTGTLTATLNNRSGNYSPTNTSGAYYPNVKRMRWIRVRAQWSAVTYARWQGLIETWDQSWPSSGKDAIVTIRAADALKILNLAKIGGNEYPEQFSGERVEAVCDDLGLTSSVSTGISTVIETASGSASIETTALSHLQNVEETENGRLFAAADGTITFQDRHYRLENSGTAIGTIGDGAGEIPYRETSLAFDDQNIWNDAVVTTSSGVAMSAEDADSQDTYFRRTIARTLLTDSETEAQSAADYLVRLYRDPAPKLPVLTLLPVRSTSLWPTVLAAKNSDRFTFKRRPVSGGTISMDGYVEQVSDTIVPGNSWDVSVQLSAATDQAFWVLGSSALGTDTFVIY